MDRKTVPRKCAFVVVLGDIGRSPRMQYHSLSLAENGLQVDLCGHLCSVPLQCISEHENIRLHNLPLAKSTRLPLIDLALKFFWNFVTLLLCMLKNVQRDGIILLQNPPAIPALIVCLLVAKLKKNILIIDWHNYTWSMFAHRWQGASIVKAVKWFEYSFAKFANFHLCVTESMKNDLKQNGFKNVITFHDRPHGHFAPLTLEEQHELFVKMRSIFGDPEERDQVDAEVVECTKFTVKKLDGLCYKRSDRPCILLTSTSWTPDEDFYMLLQALQIYYGWLKENAKLPDLHVVITGKGPLKEKFKVEIEKLEFNGHIVLSTPWLQAEDYPRVLACADIGLSLHSSTSGLDLPMKVLDMFGCRLPVLALDFRALGELVKDNINGKIFEDAHQLADCLQSVLVGFPLEDEKLAAMKEELKRNPLESWDQSWNRIILPIFKNL